MATSTAPDPAAAASLPEVGDLDRAALERLGIRWTFHEEFDLSEIDDAESLAVWSQARLHEPLDEEHVEELVSELERGEELPPIIVYRDNAKKCVTLSGNHRRRAYSTAGRTVIRAYEAMGLAELRNDDARVLHLVYEANHGHGKAVPAEDKIQQAITLINNGKTIRAAATALGIPENRVRDQFEVSRATRRLEEDLGVNTEAIPASAQRRLANIKNDRVAKELAQLVPLMDRKTQEVNELVKAVNGERTQEAQLAVVHDYAETLKSRPKSEGAGRKRAATAGVSADVRRLDTAIGTILRFNIEELRAGIPTEFRDRLSERVAQAIDHLAAAKGVL